MNTYNEANYFISKNILFIFSSVSLDHWRERCSRTPTLLQDYIHTIFFKLLLGSQDSMQLSHSDWSNDSLLCLPPKDAYISDFQEREFMPLQPEAVG